MKESCIMGHKSPVKVDQPNELTKLTLRCWLRKISDDLYLTSQRADTSAVDTMPKKV